MNSRPSSHHHHSIVLHKFVTYYQKVSHFCTQLEIYKRQLASFLKSIDYTIPFSLLDVNKKGCVNQKDLQIFLISKGHYEKDVDIHRYFLRYSHGKDHLSYEDIIESLVPHSHYIVMSTTIPLVTSAFISKQSSNYLCKKTQDEILRTLTSFLTKSFYLLSDLTSTTLQVGPLLWRHLDHNHNNHLNEQGVNNMGKQLGAETKDLWDGFVLWHFGCRKDSLNREDFMKIFGGLIRDQKSKSACQYEKLVEHKTIQKIIETQNNVELKILETAQNCLQERYRSLSNKTSKGKESHFIDTNEPLFKKRLLTSKLGYRKPHNLIKMSEVIY